MVDASFSPESPRGTRRRDATPACNICGRSRGHSDRLELRSAPKKIWRQQPLESFTAAIAAPERVSKELLETTKGLQATQQQAVDQLQVVQDQLMAQKEETRKLSEQFAIMTPGPAAVRCQYFRSCAQRAGGTTEVQSLTIEQRRSSLLEVSIPPGGVAGHI
jgi:hypothetical protein